MLAAVSLKRFFFQNIFSAIECCREKSWSDNIGVWKGQKERIYGGVCGIWVNGFFARRFQQCV
jgi:hypothetical protein